jgi:hypothetical protein
MQEALTHNSAHNVSHGQNSYEYNMMYQIITNSSECNDASISDFREAFRKASNEDRLRIIHEFKNKRPERFYFSDFRILELKNLSTEVRQVIEDIRGKEARVFLSNRAQEPIFDEKELEGPVTEEDINALLHG